MRSYYKQLGEFIHQIDVRAKDSDTKYNLSDIMGISSIYKEFQQTKANLVGVSVDAYKIVPPMCFAYNPNTARMGDKIPIALNTYGKNILVSSIYPVFSVDETKLSPEYLLLWFKRNEFDRYARYKSHGSAREIFDWEQMRKVELPVPDIEEQRKIVKAYKTITDRIELKKRINENLEATEQALLSEIITANQTTTITLDNLVEFIDGDRGKNYPNFDEFTSEGYCLFLNASNVTSVGFNFDTCMFVTEEKDKAMNNGHLSAFDIVLTSRGTLGNVALYDNNIPYKNVRINSGMLIMRPKTERISVYFIYVLLKSGYMKIAIEQFRSGSAQPQLPIKDLQKISFDIPDNDTILKTADKQFQALEETISKNKCEIDKLKALSSVLLAELSR